MDAMRALNVDEETHSLVLRLRQHFVDSNDIFLSLVRHGVQTEGWFKAEMLCFLDGEKVANRIASFDREVPFGVGKRKLDLKLSYNTIKTAALIELKHWLIGPQRGTSWYARTYFLDPSPVGIKPDVERLTNITEDSKYLLVLATSNPGEDDWSTGLQKFNTKFHPLHITSLTHPRDFSGSFFLGLLRVAE